MTALADAHLDATLPLRVRISAEFLCGPVWVTGQDVMEDCDGRSLGLDDDLVRDLLVWSEELDATYNDEDPLDSAPLPADHFWRGYALARRVRSALPAPWTVVVKEPEKLREVELSLYDH